MESTTHSLTHLNPDNPSRGLEWEIRRRETEELPESSQLANEKDYLEWIESTKS